MRWLMHMGVSVILLILSGTFCSYEDTKNLFAWIALMIAVIAVIYLIMVHGSGMEFDRHERRNIQLAWLANVTSLALVYLWNIGPVNLSISIWTGLVGQ